MKKMIMMGRSECGKTTLRQALKGSTIQYEKTQYVNHFDVIIDTPGEYAETNSLARALALYSYEADVVALTGVSSLFGFVRVSELVGALEPSIRGRLVVFFPGGYENGNYRFLDARDGWSYRAVPILASEGAFAS